MSTDSGVNDLIRQFQTRRLQTDPGDAFLFQQPSVAADHAARVPVRAVPPPRVFDRAPLLPAPAPAPSPAPAPAPARSVNRAPQGRSSLMLAPPSHAPAYPNATRDVVWPWIAATIIAGVLGLFGASYLWSNLGDDSASPSASASPAPVAAPAPMVAPFVPPPPSVAPVPPEAAAPVSAPSPASGANPVVADAVVPPVTSPSTESAPTSTSHKKAHRRRAHAKAKRTSAKH